MNSFFQYVVLSCLVLTTLAAEPNLIRYFPFDDDFTEAVHHGIPELYGQPMLTEGRFGKAVNLDGKSALLFDSRPDLDLETFTLTAWVRSDEGVPNGLVAGKGVDGYYLWINQGEVKSGFFGKQFHEGVSGIYLKPGVWYFIAVSYDGEHLRVYVDDHLHWLAAVGETPRPNKGRFVIGHEPNDPPSYHFRGRVDEVRVYDGALDSAAILELFAP